MFGIRNLSNARRAPFASREEEEGPPLTRSQTNPYKVAFSTGVMDTVLGDVKRMDKRQVSRSS